VLTFTFLSVVVYLYIFVFIHQMAQQCFTQVTRHVVACSVDVLLTRGLLLLLLITNSVVCVVVCFHSPDGAAGGRQPAPTGDYQ